MTAADIERPLPLLREDLRVIEAAPEADGAPAWVIQDPVINRFYRIGWLEFECLLRWGRNAREVATEIASATPLHAEPEQVLALAEFLESHQLVRPGPQATDRLASRSAGAPWKHWRWWLHNYLFFRIPLVRPQEFLAQAAQRLSVLIQPLTVWLLALLTGVGLLLVFRQWDVFSQAVVESISPQGLIGFAGALMLAKTLHELGHALVATHFGVRVAHMGIAFVVMWPMLYTDTGESWKLRSRHQRLAVAAAGILTELALAGLATLGWAITGPGWLNTACLYLATTSWALSLALNLSPFMRFDGYFILSDLLDFPNLHERSSALARAAIRRTLLGLEEPWPEYFPNRQRHLLVAFAMVTWMYRLVVFFGIAVAVYLFFFKALGIFLFAVELAWFIVMPVWRELRVWNGRRMEVPGSRRRWLGVLAFIGLLLVAIPWKTGARGAGLAHGARQTAVYAPYPAVITSIHASGAVPAGAELVHLDAPDLRVQGIRNLAKAGALSAQMTGLQAQDRGLEQASAMTERLGEQLAEMQATGEELGRLKLRAEFAGVWLDVDPLRRPGTWVNPQDPLGILVDPAHWQVDAYVGQSDVERLKTGAHVMFYPERSVHALRGKVVDIDTTRAARISQPMLATRHGGPIAVVAQSQELVPVDPQYRVRIELESAPESLRETRGEVLIEGGRRSLLAESIRDLLAILIRESGF